METSSGKAPNCLENPLNPDLDKTTLLDLIKRYGNHLSIVKISDVGLFHFQETLVEALTSFHFNDLLKRFDMLSQCLVPSVIKKVNSSSWFWENNHL